MQLLIPFLILINTPTTVQTQPCPDTTSHISSSFRTKLSSVIPKLMFIVFLQSCNPLLQLPLLLQHLQIPLSHLLKDKEFRCKCSHAGSNEEGAKACKDSCSSSAAAAGRGGGWGG
jgi:hypothetical protein